MMFINRFIIGCLLLLATIGCQDKAAMEAEAAKAKAAMETKAAMEAEAAKAKAAKAKIQGMMSFCRNMAIYGEQDDLADNIILSEAEILGFNVEGEDAQRAFRQSHIRGQLAIMRLNSDNALAAYGMGTARSGKPEGLYVADCLKSLKEWSAKGSVTMP